MKDKIQTLRPNERIREMVEAIQKEKGLKRIADVYMYCVGEIYHKLFPIYAGKRGALDTRDPEEIAKHNVAIKEAEKKAREDISLAEQIQVCEISLHGEVVDQSDGKYCQFNTYHFDTANLQKVPIEMCTPEFAKHQKVEQKK